MFFGLSNAPINFQVYINKILAKKLDIFLIVCLDDILIYIKNKSQRHINAIWWVFEKLRKYSLFTNLKKCCFYKNKVHFIKYEVLI